MGTQHGLLVCASDRHLYFLVANSANFPGATPGLYRQSPHDSSLLDHSLNPPNLLGLAYVFNPQRMKDGLRLPYTGMLVNSCVLLCFAMWFT